MKAIFLVNILMHTHKLIISTLLAKNWKEKKIRTLYISYLLFVLFYLLRRYYTSHHITIMLNAPQFFYFENNIT